MPDSEKPRESLFYGLQPRWFKANRFYRINVSEKMIAGAYVAGEIFDRESADLMFNEAGVYFGWLIRRRLAERHAREAQYDAIDPFCPSFLEHDERNFQLLRTDVVRTRFRRNRSYWTPFNVGVVELELLDGRWRRFILAGNQRPDEILELMKSFDPAIEVTGKPNPLPRRKPASAREKRIAFVTLGAMLLGLAAFLAFAGQGNPQVLLVIILSLVSGVWFLARAFCASDDPPQSETPG